MSAARHPIVGGPDVARFLTNVGRLLEDTEELHVNGESAMLFRSRMGSYLYVVEHRGGRVCGIQVQANPAKLAAVRPTH